MYFEAVVEHEIVYIRELIASEKIVFRINIELRKLINTKKNVHGNF